MDGRGRVGPSRLWKCAVACLLLLTSIVNGYAEIPARYASLIDKMRAMNASAVAALLQSAGYTDVQLGGLHEPEVVAGVPLKTRDPEYPSEKLVGHTCFPVSLNTTTKYMGKVDAETEEVTPESFLQVDEETEAIRSRNALLRAQERLLTGHQSKIRMAASKDDTTNLDCECKPYECHCAKQCFCRLSADPFQGLHFPPEANCPVCPVCVGAGGKGSEKSQEGAKTAIEQDFKCSCNFEGVGGPGLSEGGYMECDCKVADCTCEKECQCRKKGGAKSMMFKEAAGKTVKIDEKDIKKAEKHHEEPRKLPIQSSESVHPDANAVYGR